MKLEKAEMGSGRKIYVSVTITERIVHWSATLYVPRYIIFSLY